jgi:D-tyrosyl-tRNA(Tyr) deacylase
MRVVLQRVLEARVEVEGRIVGEIGPGFVLLTGMAPGDGAAEIGWMARKIAGLRVFEDAEGKMNLPLSAVGGRCLVVSQFTLFGDCRKGFRPGFTGAAPAADAAAGVEAFVEALRALDVPVATGVFQAHMRVALVNDGPVTLILDREAGN